MTSLPFFSNVKCEHYTLGTQTAGFYFCNSVGSFQLLKKVINNKLYNSKDSAEICRLRTETALSGSLINVNNLSNLKMR